MKKLLVATGNIGKLHEISGFLKDLPFELVSLKDLKIKDDVKEDGTTYQENSQKKAKYYAKKSELPTIADDGGLEIDALNGQPGVHSRRWLGYDASDEVLIEHLKKVIKDLPKGNHKAKFKTVVSFALPNSKVWSFVGEVEGVLMEDSNMKLLIGYPYRSFFYLPKLKKFYHENELTEKEQKIYNHRYKAIQKLKSIIRKYA